MKILHTSDWHLGKTLFGEKRYNEHEKFLTWLIGVLKDENIDLIIIAGDIFDTTTPSNRAQELYYSFLCNTKTTSCRHVVIIGGNHDSPSFLSAPQELLKHLNIHVVSDISDRENEIIEIKNNEGKQELIVCAVPYLKDRDVRLSVPGESGPDKEANLLDGIRSHYEEIHAKAKDLKEKYNVPLISTGHLFTKNGKVEKDDGVRELYIGSLARVDGTIFPDFVDYTALGHLHVPQTVGERDNVRYSGSPIPMGFNEGYQNKKVIIVDIRDFSTTITEKTVPVFRKLVSLKGNEKEVLEKFESIKEDTAEELEVWVELIGKGFETTAKIMEIAGKIEESGHGKVLKIENADKRMKVISPLEEFEALEELGPVDVFERLMEIKEVSEDNKKELKGAFEALIYEIQNEDKNKE